MNRADIKNTAKSMLSGKWLYSVIAVFIANFICVYIPTIISKPKEMLGSFYQGGESLDVPIVVVAALFLLVIPYITAGLSVYCLKVARGMDAKIIDLFEQNHILLKSVVLNLLTYLFIALWSLLFIIPGIVAYYRYRLAFFVLVDNPQMSAMEALRESKRLTRGKKFDMFVLDLSFIGWWILASIACMVGNLWLDPYVKITYAVYYDTLKRG